MPLRRDEVASRAHSSPPRWHAGDVVIFNTEPRDLGREAQQRLAKRQLAGLTGERRKWRRKGSSPPAEREGHAVYSPPARRDGKGVEEGSSQRCGARHEEDRDTVARRLHARAEERIARGERTRSGSYAARWRAPARPSRTSLIARLWRINRAAFGAAQPLKHNHTVSPYTCAPPGDELPCA